MYKFSYVRQQICYHFATRFETLVTVLFIITSRLQLHVFQMCRDDLRKC